MPLSLEELNETVRAIGIPPGVTIAVREHSNDPVEGQKILLTCTKAMPGDARGDLVIQTVIETEKLDAELVRTVLPDVFERLARNRA